VKHFLVTVLPLVVLLAVSPAAMATPPVLIPVTGVADLLDGQVGGDLVPDQEGNLHLRQAAFRGRFALHGEGVDIQGTQLLVLTGALDETLSGPVAGHFTVTVIADGQPTVVWQGTIYGFVKALSFTGWAIAHGTGPYAGQTLTLAFQERPATPTNPNPEVFDLAGFLARH
jgi:hypothetical protein